MGKEKRVMSLLEMQHFVVESLPMVGPGLAKKLLEYFGSVEAVFAASEAELQKVENVGEKRAKEIRKLITTVFELIV